jgi:hypothetical protein
MKVLRLLLLATLAASLCGAAKKPKLVVHFHVEAIGNAGGSFTMPVKFTNPPREGHVETIAFASERNIAAVFPVENPDGTLGCAFQLDQSGRFALESVSKDRRGASIVVTMRTKTGSHQVIDMVIDKPITDGIIYVPTGISPGEMQFLRELYPIMGQPKGKKKKK